MRRAGRPEGFLAGLSCQAIHWAARVPRPAPGLLRRRLYDFNRLPITPSWADRLRHRRAAVRFLGTDRRPPSGWRRRPHTSNTGWIGFERLEPGGSSPLQSPAGPFKLYVSPHPEYLPSLIESLWPLLADLPVTAMKVADSAAGLLRPDKLIVYSPRLEWIEDLARRLLCDSKNSTAQGVPFSAEIGGAGLLSWGVDLHGVDRHGVDRHRGASVRSWRSWIVERIATALFEASRQPRHRGPPGLSVRRALEPEGIDIDRWQPLARLWRPPE